MKNAKVQFAAIIFMLLPVFSAGAASVSGRVVTEGAAPVPDSTVILLELEFVTVTGNDGYFIFEDVADSEYTVMVISPGFEDKQFIVNASDKPLLLSLSPAVIEMDTITINAGEEKISDQIKEGVTSEELERQPVRADPFKALALESGIIKELDIINFNMNFDEGGGRPDTVAEGPIVIPEGRISIGGRNEVSVYGGMSDWNNYYYDYIRMPTNTHTFGFPEADAVVPREAVDSIEIHRGAYPVEYGPGIGGLFSLNPISGFDGLELTLTPSIMDVSGIASLRISDNINMLLSLNQSVLNYTVLPLITGLSDIQSEEDLVEGDIPTSISYGDALLRFLFTPPGNSISIDLLGYYDRWAFDLAFENASLNSIYGPYYLAGGSRWISSISEKFSNSLYLFGSLYKDTGNFDLYLPRAENIFITDYNLSWVSNVNSLQLGEEIQWNILPEITLLAGVNGRLSDLAGTYADENVVVNENGDVQDEFGYRHDLLFEQGLLSAYGYIKVLGRLNSLEYKAGAGLLLYPETGTLRPAAEGEVIYSAETSSFAFAAGWSPGVIDEFTYIDRRLDELYYELDSETSAYQPPMAASAAAQALFLFENDSSLKLSPYFSWYYDLSGISVNTSYTDLDDTFVSLNPSKGYSTGFDIGWGTKNREKFNWDLSYALSWTRYYTDTLDWIAPNTEVRHALKGSGLYENGGFKTGLSLFVYSGIPFTPQVVEVFGSETRLVQGEYNSAIEWIPTYELTTNISYKWELKSFSLTLFLNSSNLVDGLNISTNGLKEELKTTAGATTADFNSRSYSFSYNINNFLMTLLTSEIGLSFNYKQKEL